MPFLTNANKTLGFWILVLGLLVLLWHRGRKRGRVLVVLLAITLPATDLVSSHVAKNIYFRHRPCYPIHYVRGSRTPAPPSDLVTATIPDSTIPGDRILPPGARPLTSSSFPSSHSATMASLAAMLIWAFRKRTRWAWLALLIPLIIGYSRIYVGVHYPTDVLCGWILGGSVGALACWFAARWESNSEKNSAIGEQERREEGETRRQAEREGERVLE